MRVYLEANETTEDTEGEFIRADVTGMGEQETAEAQTAIEGIMQGKPYRLMRHFCYHEEGLSCRMELIKEARV